MELNDEPKLVCTEYNGSVIGRCSMGIQYSQVWVATETPGPGLYPCFKDDGVPERCDHVLYDTPSVSQEEGERIFEQLLMRIAADLENGICPICRETIEEREDVGGSAWLLPCGHSMEERAIVEGQGLLLQQPTEE